jgi:hypothetical protein
MLSSSLEHWQINHKDTKGHQEDLMKIAEKYSDETPHLPAPEGVKKIRRVGGPGLQHPDKSYGIIVGRVPSRGVFQFLHTSPLLLGTGVLRRCGSKLSSEIF